MFEAAAALPALFSKDCYRQEDVWADMAEPGNAITRVRSTDILCLTIGVQERGQWLLYFSLSETSPAMTESPLVKRIRALLDAYADHPPAN